LVQLHLLKGRGNKGRKARGNFAAQTGASLRLAGAPAWHPLVRNIGLERTAALARGEAAQTAADDPGNGTRNPV
jgi:hypothetical protein